MTSAEWVASLQAAIELAKQHAEKDIWMARHASQGRWYAREGFNLPASWVQTDESPIAKFDGPNHGADAGLVSRFKPELVIKRAKAALRLVQAHRDIVELHGHTTAINWQDRSQDFEICLACGSGHPDVQGCEPWPCQTLILLARGYGVEERS